MFIFVVFKRIWILASLQLGHSVSIKVNKWSSSLTKGHIAVTHGRFNSIRQVASMFTNWAQLSPHPKRHRDRFSHFCTAHGIQSLYEVLCFFYISREASPRRNVHYILVTAVCVSVCMFVRLSLATFPQYCMDPDVSWENGRGCPLVAHHWADFQLMHGFGCYDNTAPNAKCQRVLVLALCLVNARRSYASAVLGVVILSVRLSVTRVLCD